MGRPPLGKKAMTAAERQRKRRKKLRKEKLQLGRKAEAERRRLKMAEAYIPMPPGITYWHQVPVQTAEGARLMWQPTTRPLASMCWSELTDADLASLREHLDREAAKRASPGAPGLRGGEG